MLFDNSAGGLELRSRADLRQWNDAANAQMVSLKYDFVDSCLTKLCLCEFSKVSSDLANGIAEVSLEW